MKKEILAIAGLVLATTGFLLPNAALGGMVFTSSVTAYLENQPPVDIDFTATSFPTSQLVDATAGDYYSQVLVDYTQSGEGGSFSNDILQRRNGLVPDESRGDSIMTFTVGTDSTYNLSGYYDVTPDGSSESPGLVFLKSSLYDTEDHIYLWYDEQHFANTSYVRSVLGGNGGDIYNYSTGSLSGSLVAGRIYEWSWSARTQTDIVDDGGTSAVGNMSLVIGVPEPASLAVWGFGALGMLFAYRKRRQVNLEA